jgi:formylglycine-generating enzyme required for sulfatase activity
MVRIPAGELRPFYRSAAGAGGDARIAVPAFELDERPVSNAAFLAFVRAHPEWSRSHVRRIFADEHYLANWAGDFEPGDAPGAAADAPVVNVSWFAARAYAASLGKRLPTLAEWEYAASAPGVDGRSPSDVVLAWYATPASGSSAARHFRNTFGIVDLHGAIWEWVEDFNAAAAAFGSDSRTRETIDRARFCGAGSLDAIDRNDYATFLRYAFRSSLEGRNTGRQLGFRCARDFDAGASASLTSAVAPSNERTTSGARTEAAQNFQP